MHTMVELARKTRSLSGIPADRIPFDELMQASEPVILRGLASEWPLVQRGRESAASAVEYLKSFCGPRPATVYHGDPSIHGRFAYDESFTAFNYTAQRAPLADILTQVLAHADDDEAPAFYAGSTDVDTFLPGLRAQNDLVLDHEMFRAFKPIVSIWLGNRTVAAAHFDESHNLACCMVGRRRFT
jgi:hypothetical protein